MSVPFSISDPYDHNGDSVVAINDGTTTWIQMTEMVNELPLVYNMDVRKDDVWLLGYPKSGNTWASEMLWTMYHGTKEANKISYFERICWPEMRAYHTMGVKNLSEEKRKHVDIKDSFKEAVESESPRILRCHLPMALLPPKLLDTAKVIFICRDLKDVAVSFFKMLQGTGVMGGDVLEPFIDDFIADKGMNHPVCEQIREAWEKRHHPNMYFLFYEDMKKDLAGEMRKVAAFVGKSITDEQVKELEDYLSVESMRKNKNVNMDAEYKEMGLMGESATFIRKGVAGDWKNHFTPDMNKKWDQWISEKFAGTDFKFRD